MNVISEGLTPGEAAIAAERVREDYRTRDLVYPHEIVLWPPPGRSLRLRVDLRDGDLFVTPLPRRT